MQSNIFFESILQHYGMNVFLKNMVFGNYFGKMKIGHF